jgi:hypothetical protein
MDRRAEELEKKLRKLGGNILKISKDLYWIYQDLYEVKARDLQYFDNLAVIDLFEETIRDLKGMVSLVEKEFYRIKKEVEKRVAET